MVSIPTPIPKTLVRVVRRGFSGSVLDILWKLGVVTVLVMAAYALALLGVVGAAISGVILASLVTEPVRNAIRDVWNRNFWVFRT
ncbi:hypothetical protein CP557_21935 [Natrinema ejinorense]|uniref:Uncharacterized protein n=2 Tax=Natrinema ejinorense TaxID=373386 RepID=A0A2A5QPD6_9EURY|nr:hypothetical protein CP557_21935 [Natrinema ejinorense]